MVLLMAYVINNMTDYSNTLTRACFEVTLALLAVHLASLAGREGHTTQTFAKGHCRVESHRCATLCFGHRG